MCLISASLMRLWTPVGGGGGDRAVFPTSIDRCLFVFAIGPDFINPACVMITVPPSHQVSKRVSVRV